MNATDVVDTLENGRYPTGLEIQPVITLVGG